jgi:hypothetical protein
MKAFGHCRLEVQLFLGRRCLRERRAHIAPHSLQLFLCRFGGVVGRHGPEYLFQVALLISGSALDSRGCKRNARAYVEQGTRSR